MPAPHSIHRAPHPRGLYDVLELILDKGLVVDLYVRVSLIGIEILTIDARIVIASVDSDLRFAEADNRLDLTPQGGRDLPELIEDIGESGGQSKTKGALSGVKDAITGGDDDDDDGRERQRSRRRRRSSDDEE